MTDLVALVGVEEQDMIGIRNRLIGSDMPQIDTPIGKYQMRFRSAFLHAAMAAFSAAMNVAQCHRIGGEQRRDMEFGRGRHRPHFNPKSYESRRMKSCPIVFGQGAKQYGVKYLTVLAEDQKVRVLRCAPHKGDKTPMHSHPAAVVYVLKAGKVRYTLPDGSTIAGRSVRTETGRRTSQSAQRHLAMQRQVLTSV
jgi:hypothetical protein